MDSIPHTLGRYRVRRQLGEGGMGAVFFAETEGGTPVVLKMPVDPSAPMCAFMGDEARIGFRLHHPHIVRTLDFFKHEGRPVLVIEFVDGASMKELRDHVGKLPPAMIARIGEQVSDALATIHHLKDDRSGEPLRILHRDVTPGNILIDRNGDAKLIDLGIARSVESQSEKTSAGVLRGTLGYLSPDLFAGLPYSWMTDLWALGVSLFEGAVGRRALRSTDVVNVFRDLAAGKLTALQPGEELNPMLRFLFDGLLVVDSTARRFRDPEEVLHAFRVIRGRLGDGNNEARELMRRVGSLVSQGAEAAAATERTWLMLDPAERTVDVPPPITVGEFEDLRVAVTAVSPPPTAVIADRPMASSFLVEPTAVEEPDRTITMPMGPIVDD